MRRTGYPVRRPERRGVRALNTALTLDTVQPADRAVPGPVDAPRRQTATVRPLRGYSRAALRTTRTNTGSARPRALVDFVCAVSR